MTNERIVAVTVDPLDPATGLLFPFVAQRVLAFAREHHVELDPTHLTRVLLARVMQGDPRIRLTAFVNEKGDVKGHTFAAIESDGANNWLYIFQAQADANVGDLLRKSTTGLSDDVWLAEHQVSFIMMSTGRRERGWERSYGFKPLRSLMYKPLHEDAKEREG